MSDQAVKVRKNNPTRYTNNGKLQPGKRAMRQRRKDTFKAALEIHGGTNADVTPGEIGLLQTVMKNVNTKTLLEGMSNDKKICGDIIPKISKTGVKLFEKSRENMIRSVAVYYSGGVMGKKKYRAVYRDMNYKKHIGLKKVLGKKRVKSKRIKVNNCDLPRLVPYNKLMPFVKSLDIGTLHSVRETFCSDLPVDDKVDGVFRQLSELLPRMAEHYLNQDQYELKWFNGETNTFYVSIGGDGAPFGKEDTACAWLISFLNIGSGVLSSNENFLLFGANCQENGIVMKRFIENLTKEINEIENQKFSVDCHGSPVDVTFNFTELPNDMKMLSFLAGEVTNSATYFSTFANASILDFANLSGTFGEGDNNLWKPWEYEERVKVAADVDRFKLKMRKAKLAESTKRTKITSFIASQKSRQEFVPLVGKLIDKAHVDPLHLKNNACALAHRNLLEEVILQSDLKHCPSISFSQLPRASPFVKYISALRECNLSRLAKRVIRWFDETRTNGRPFDYRFTGRDSRLFLHSFMLLISAVDPGSSCPGRLGKVYHCIAYLCLCLRDCVSLFSRVNITDQELIQLRSLCVEYFRTNVVFFKVNPTVWTIGHIVAAHTESMKSTYGLGLGLNSMEGREAKHIFIAKYATNTVPKHRWEQIFLHEYVSLLWLRERGYNCSKPVRSSASYLPKGVVNKVSTVCICGMTKEESSEKCLYCDHALRSKIMESVRSGKDTVFT